MVRLCFSSFSREIQGSAHPFSSQRVVIVPTRRTAAVLSLRAVHLGQATLAPESRSRNT